MKAKEIMNKTQADLTKLLTEKRESLRAFRFGNAQSKTKNTREGSALRKDIARILTAMNDKK